MAIQAQAFSPRQSMNCREFEVFHYRANKPENVRIHHHDFYELYLFCSGNVDFRVEGRTYHLEPGDLMLISPREFHQLRVDPAVVYERFVLWIDCGYLSSLSTPELPLQDCFDHSAPRRDNLIRPDRIRRAALQRLLEQLVTEFYSDQPGSALYARGLFLQLMVEVNRLVRGSGAGESLQEAPDLVSQVLSYIGTHFEEALTLEQLSAEFFVSKYHLSREFRQRVGTGICHYIICKRLLRARELMEGGCAPGEVFHRCGFGDYANFYRAFRKEYGCSPRACLPEHHEL